MAEEKEKKETSNPIKEESASAKTTADEKKDKEKKTEDKTPAVSDDKTSTKKLEEKEEKLELSPNKEEKKKPVFDEELPDDVKKKLEERKNNKKVVRKGRKKKKEKTRVESGKVYIKATYNNTIVTITDLNGNVISWASAGIAGFKGPKKATSYAAQIIAKIACIKAKEDFGLKEVSVFVNGVGTGREAAVRAINANGLNVTSIKDVTPIPHNGCRPKKPRRV